MRCAVRSGRQVTDRQLPTLQRKVHWGNAHCVRIGMTKDAMEIGTQPVPVSGSQSAWSNVHRINGKINMRDAVTTCFHFVQCSTFFSKNQHLTPCTETWLGLQKLQTIDFRHVRKMRNATISFVMSVCLLARMEQLGSHWTDFSEIWYLRVSRKSAKKI